MLNYYGKFIPNLSSEIKPVTELLHKDREWNWTVKCQEAFERTKAQLATAPVLTHYDPKLPVMLACDASPYGIGAVISHQFSDGSEKPIAYMSRTLTKTEVNYSLIEKEALGIIFGVTKFNDYLYGWKCTLFTDHKPLLKILGPKTGVPVLAAARLQRWSLTLSAYQYDIRYKPSTQHANADALSRLPLQTQGTDSPYDSVFRVSFLDKVPVSSLEIAKQTKADSVLQRAKQLILNGNTELTVESDCVMWGFRVVIPEVLRSQLLRELHENHQGMVKMKALARSHFWWLNLDSDIESLVSHCQICQLNRNQPVTAPVHNWSWPNRPWQRIHIDFALKGKQNFLVVTDSYSHWPEVALMSSTTAEKTIEVLRGYFSTWGLPD